MRLPPQPPDSRPWLIAADWQSRTLLLAELEERGVEARTEAGVQEAIAALLRERLAPPLLLLDPRGDPDATPAKVQRILAILEEDGVQPTLILFVPTFDRAHWEQAMSDRATILARPKTVGEVAGLVVRALTH